jgi:hypothetical protein
VTSEETSRNLEDTPDFWWIGPEIAPLLVENAEAAMPYLPYYMVGWKIAWAGATAPRPPDVRIIEHKDGTFSIIVLGPGGVEYSFDNPYDAANGLADELVRAFVGGEPEMIGLLAGAVRIGEGLIIVMGNSSSEISTVVLHLAVLGHRLFGDEKIALTLENPPRGICLGLTPKISLPLNDDCGEAFQEFVEGYSVMQSDQLAYLKLWEGEAAVFSEQIPVRALLFLDRVDPNSGSISPEIYTASRSELSKLMDQRAFARHLTPSDLTSGLSHLAETADGYRLRFSSSREAATLLSNKFR